MYRLTDLDPARPPSLLHETRSWPANRERIAALWREYIGELPEPVPVRWRVLGESSAAGGVTRLHIGYDAPGRTPGEPEQVTAHLLMPSADRRLPVPGVLALHPTHRAGKEAVTVAGVARDRTYGLELAQRGYVVLAPDGIASGERVVPGSEYWDTSGFYRSNPGWTVIGRMLTDHRQGIDLLQSLDEVDGARIAAVGHSLGGYNAVFLAGIDPRVTVTVSSCGSSMWAGDPAPNRWYRPDTGTVSPFVHLPRLGTDLDAGAVPFEWHEITALVAPRRLLVYATTNDDCFPHHQSIAAGMAEVGRVYEALGRVGDFDFLLGNGTHDFPPHIRQAAYAFVDAGLSCTSPG